MTTGGLNFNIAGKEFDCEYSHSGDWMLPNEKIGQIVLVTKAEDPRSTWTADLVGVTEEIRRTPAYSFRELRCKSVLATRLLGRPDN